MKLEEALPLLREGRSIKRAYWNDKSSLSLEGAPWSLYGDDITADDWEAVYTRSEFERDLELIAAALERMRSVGLLPFHRSDVQVAIGAIRVLDPTGERPDTTATVSLESGGWTVVP